VSNKWWSADHGLLATDTLASIVDTLALISFLKGACAAPTADVSEFRRHTLCFEARHRNNNNNNNINKLNIKQKLVLIRLILIYFIY
jgi:hypothetical protein